MTHIFNNLAIYLRNKPPEKLFLLIAVPFCMFFLFAIPALQGWDEATHFSRAYQVAEFNLRADQIAPEVYGGLLPVNVINMHDEFLKELIAAAESGYHRSTSIDPYISYITVNTPSKERLGINFTGSATYSPVAYIPSALGIDVARLLHMPLLAYIYMGRIATLVVWLFLMYQAIKRIAIGKWVLVCLGLLPTSITHAVSFAPDAILIGAASLLIAIFVDYLASNKQLSKKATVLILVLLLTIALTKPTYLIFAGLFLFLPWKRFGSIKRFAYLNVLFIIPTLTISLLWLGQVRPIVEAGPINQRPGLNVNPEKQVEYLKHHPVQYSAVLANSVFTNNSNYHVGMLTSYLTWKSTPLPQWTVLLSYSTLLFACLSIRNEVKKLNKKLLIPWWSRYGPLALILTLVIALYTTLYIGFTEVGLASIGGMHGRYFLPLVPLLIPFLIIRRERKWLSIDTDYIAPVLSGIIIVVLIVAAITVIAANYINDLFVIN